MRELLSAPFFDRSVHEVAPDLIGATLLVDGAGGTIVEVEAYHPTDPASHSLPRPDRAQRVDVRPARHAYVYRSYGVHWCLNLVCEDEGAARLLSARSSPPPGSSGCAPAAASTIRGCSAPGPAGCARRSASLARTTASLSTRRRSSSAPRPAAVEVATGPRIGITRAVELPWRYALAGSPS